MNSHTFQFFIEKIKKKKYFSTKKLQFFVQCSINFRHSGTSKVLFRCSSNSISITVFQCMGYTVKLLDFVKFVVGQHRQITKIPMRHSTSSHQIIYFNSIACKLFIFALKSHDQTILLLALVAGHRFAVTKLRKNRAKCKINFTIATYTLFIKQTIFHEWIQFVHFAH